MYRTVIHLVSATAFAAVLACGSPASAAPISTERAIAESPAASAADERERVKRFFERDDVRGKIQALGVAPELAFKRVDALTDAEIAQLAAKIDRLPAGGDIGKNTLILILVLILVLALI